MNKHDRESIQIQALYDVCKTDSTFRLSTDAIKTIEDDPGLRKALELSGLVIKDRRLVKGGG